MYPSSSELTAQVFASKPEESYRSFQKIEFGNNMRIYKPPDQFLDLVGENGKVHFFLP